MLWLAIRFPLLALEVHTRGGAVCGPLAVADTAAAGARIIACNQEAGRRGLRRDMPVAAASALASDLRLFARDAQAECAALERVAAWALQFTSTVSIAPPDEVLLETAGSLRLFGGLGRLWARIAHEAGATGYTALMAGAPTALAAQWFARAGLSPRIRHPDALRLGLERLPISVLELPPALSEWLANIGVCTLGQCLELPRDGLARRAGGPLLDQLDRALGRVPDPRPVFLPPPRYRATLPLPAPVEDAGMLLFAARRLVAELCGWLTATGQGAQRLGFLLSHEGGATTRFTLDLLAASRDPAHLTNILRERLERVALPGPALSMTLASEIVLPLTASSSSFLPGAREQAEGVARFLERLRARLGENAVRGLDTVPDHRPERAWRACEPGNGAGAWAAGSPLARPLWLLHAPRLLTEIREIPQYEGPLALATMAERIESGWWDGHDVRREYFVARSPGESLLWIYRECREGGGWYLHGFFA